ncbi:MAG: cytochrome c3 family protein [Candidatus Omnitrophota bacterium]|nr:cytochrome c3 family protein [Candidatus Omnitrophota bacterium]
MQKRCLRLVETGALAILILGVIGCRTMPPTGVVLPPPEISGAEFIGMDSCAMCHEKIVKDFEETEHSRIVVSSQELKGQACEACHGAGSLHADAQTKQEKKATIVNPGKTPEACYKCHLDKKAEFSLEYHHPVPEGKMSCTDCHDPHSPGVKPGSNASLFDKNDLCAKCHKDQTRPFVYEHEALREGCSVCHNAHGSINSKMLKQRDANLCLKCHYQVQTNAANFNIGDFPHATRIPRGVCFSGGCHTAVHGSNYDDHLKM